MSEGIERPRKEWTLTGGGEMGDLMRSLDWSRNPLGPVETWPQSLRTVLSILLTSKHPIFIWWGKDLIQFYNDAYRPILGEVKHPKAMGQRGREGWAEIWDVIAPMIEAVMERGESTFIEDGLLVLNRFGFLEECYFTYAYSPIRDESGGVGGVFVACTENTKRVLSDRRLRVLSDLGAGATERTTLAGACEGAMDVFATDPNDIPFALLYLFDPDGKSARLGGACGVRAGAAIAPETILLEEDPVAGHWPLGQASASGTTLLQGLSAFPGPVPAGPWPEPIHSALLLPISRPGSPKPIGVLIVGLSPRLVLEGDYRQFLELAAGQIAASLASVNAYDQERKRSEALAALDRAKTDFFSNVSHEFRTPLTLMLGPLEDSLADREHPLDAAQRERAELIQRNGLRLMGLVNNLLEFSRIESGRTRVAFSPTDLPALTAGLASLFRSAMEKAGIGFRIECPPMDEPAYVDAEMWEKIVLNLLSNAYKFTRAGAVSLSLARRGDALELEVKDTGIGIPKDDLPLVFDRFHRVRDTPGHVQEGSGIGLAMVQDYVKIHGGTVSVESEPGQGSCFRVRIPAGLAHLPPEKIASAKPQEGGSLDAHRILAGALTREPGPAGEPSPAERIRAEAPLSVLPGALKTASGRPVRILLADDHEDMRAYLVRILSPYWHLEVVQDGLSALASLRANPPDLVLTDVMMPGLDGFGVLKAIRADPATAAIPVILLSARAGEEATLEGIEAGADDYLVKPFSSRELLVRIAARLEVAEMRKREHAAHAEADEQRYRLNSLFMDAPTPICILKGPDHVFDFVNPPYQCLFNGQALLGKTLAEAVPTMAPAMQEILDGVYRGTPFYGTEFPITLDGGKGVPEEKSFNFIYQPIRLRSGEINGIVVYALEVTIQVHARRAAEAAEKEAHRFLALVEQSSDFIALGDMQGRLTFINEAGRRLIGIDASAKVSGTSPVSISDLGALIPPGEAAAAGRILAAVREQGRWEGEIRFLHAVTGKTLPVWCNFFQFRPEGGGDHTALAFIARDLSQLRETEEHLRHAQKMEAIGKLAGGIAHDFNNLLTAINGYGDLALSMVQDGTTLKEYLREIRNGGERAATLTRQLLAYSRKQVLQPKKLDLNGIVRDVQKILERLIGEHIELRTAFAPDLALVKADPGQVEQILLNLVLNARDAMPQGGRLTIETANETVDAGFAAAQLESQPGPYAVLTVRDTGTGMSKEVQARAFEPFFTTKEVGKGTGLGLSSVYGIIKQSGGAITLASEEGVGTTFRIYLPALAFQPASAENKSAPAPAAAGSPQRGETILLVEDEQTVLTYISRVLEQRGFQVLTARSGEHAMEIRRARPGHIDLLLSDVVMPGLSGRTLAELFGKISPETRILLMSGYTGDESMNAGGTDSTEGFLQKPFTASQLLDKIDSLLGYPQPSRA